MPSSTPNALQLYIRAQPAGWGIVRDFIRQGQTNDKDIVIVLDPASDKVHVAEIEPNGTGLFAGNADGAEQLRRMLLKRDRSKGQHVFLVKCDGGWRLMLAGVVAAQ